LKQGFLHKGGIMRCSKFYTIAAILIFLAGCKKSSNPATPQKSYIDSYADGIQLIDASGTTYTGDYYPLTVGRVQMYEGEQSTTTTYSSSNTPDSFTGAIMGWQEVLPKQLISLPSGADSLYPISELTGQGMDTIRFFKKDTIAVYIKAFKLPDGNFTEIVDPVFIKSRLVVGDSWDAAPRYDMTQSLASQNIPSATDINLNMDAKSKFFVLGQENITIPNIGERSSIRLDQANDITVTGSMVVQGTAVNINVASQFAAIYHLIADTGIVHQNIAGDIHMSFGYGTQSMWIHIKINKSELYLTSITYYYPPPPPGPAPLKPGFEGELQNLSKEIARAVLKGCTL
jgi:hypothetical protein